MFGSLAWTQILMNAQYECWIVKSPIPTSDITQETVADRFPWGIPEVAKLSIPVLNLSIGPVPSDRGGGAPSTIRQLASCLAIRPLDRFGINPLSQDF